TLVHAKGWKVGNVDVTIAAQAPKLAPHIDSMRVLVAEDLQVELDQVNIKATTTEKLGFVGRRQGVAVDAGALLLPLRAARTANGRGRRHTARPQPGQSARRSRITYWLPT